MIETLNSLNINVALIAKVLVTLFIIDLMALGVVFTFGRMLILVKSNRIKNLVAILSIGIFSFFRIISQPPYSLSSEIMSHRIFFLIADIVTYITIGVVIYVLFYWRLYSRIDKLLDKRVAEDDDSEFVEEEIENKSKTKVNKKKKKLRD